MFLAVLLHLVILQGAVNEVFSYRLSRFSKEKNVGQRASKRGHKKPDLRVPDPKDSITSPSRPISLDLLVVVDGSCYRYHGDDTEHYVMDMLNVAASLWRSSSLNADVRLSVVNIEILKESQNDLEITEHANLSLRRFCQWQNTRYVTDYADRVRYNVAILMTRIDIQVGGNYDATGVAYKNGVCNPQYHCAICEDKSPMVLSHTVAHEIGHLLGIRHDGERNTCPDRVNIMSGYATGGHPTFLWSKCSRLSLAEFLSSNQAICLYRRDASSRTPVVALDTVAMPGRTYDADYQCQMIYGPAAKTCKAWIGSRICSILKCRMDDISSECVTDGRPALQGTSCGALKWCSGGMCVQRSVQLDQLGDNTNKQRDEPTYKPYYTESSTFPYMDTPAPAIIRYEWKQSDEI